MGARYHLFERFGVELEYMIVDRATLDVRPIADELLRAIAGSYLDEVRVGALTWSNELAAHLIELKTAEPVASLDGLEKCFQEGVRRIDRLLTPMGARLMPSAAHPWMDPETETKLWPHQYNAVYESLHRIFGCRGHGWSNLQAAHINLPFADDDEFGRLHAAIRILLPILPALAASSPLLDGQETELADSRMEVYRHHCRRIPSLIGRVIPEPVFSRVEYEKTILQRLYRDVRPFDPEGILQEEWINARGAIARFSRNTLEIRVLDMQECPQADLAILTLIVETLQALVRERWCTFSTQRRWSTDALEPILLETIRHGGRAVIRDSDYPTLFGLEGRTPCMAMELWQFLFDRVFPAGQCGGPCGAALEAILQKGCLSDRIVRALDGNENRPRLAEVYRELCDCLADGRSFLPVPAHKIVGPRPVPWNIG